MTPVQAKPSNLQIVGVGLMLFSSVLLGVGIHHLIATGTCSSTGYSANYGPVPTCPSGTGAWFAFVFGGIIGSLIGSLMAGGVGLVFAGIFGAIGFGSLSLVLDSHVHSGTKVFGGVFGGCFAAVGVVAGISVISSAVGSLRRPSGRSAPAHAPTASPGFGTAQPVSAFGTPPAASAFGGGSDEADPILSAYNASRGAPSSAPTPAPPSSAPSPLGLIPGLQAAKRAAPRDAVDELAKLADLHQSGALTDAEFAKAKAKLLGTT